MRARMRSDPSVPAVPAVPSDRTPAASRPSSGFAWRSPAPLVTRVPTDRGIEGCPCIEPALRSTERFDERRQHGLVLHCRDGRLIVGADLSHAGTCEHECSSAQSLLAAFLATFLAAFLAAFSATLPPALGDACAVAKRVVSAREFFLPLG